MTFADLTVPDLVFVGFVVASALVLCACYPVRRSAWWGDLLRDIGDTSTVDAARAPLGRLEADPSYRIAREKQRIVLALGPVCDVAASAMLELAVERFRDNRVPSELLLGAVLFVYDGHSAEGEVGSALIEGRA